MQKLSSEAGPIGIFDSGYGGLTILHGIRQLLPQYDFLYLGDNARAPYGPRSFDVVYEFTRQAVVRLFEMGCHLVILGCNTASAKALRTIQQNDLPVLDPTRRVLGIIRPTAEVIGRGCACHRGYNQERELYTRNTKTLSRYCRVGSGMPFLGATCGIQ